VAVVDRERVLAGALQGVSVAVDGGLVTAEEAVHAGDFLPEAESIARQVIEQEPGELLPWQQYTAGQVVGTAVAARTFAGTMSGLNVDAIGDALRRIWEIVDRF
jgi:hypothetical protein